MLRLFRAGFIAALMQLLIVGLVTLVAVLSVRHGLIFPTSSDVDTASISTLLTWIYLLAALGVALTCNRFVDYTAARIRRASQLLRPTEPGIVTKALLAQLWLAAVGFAMLARRAPPELLTEAGRNLGCSVAASIAWSGTMNIGAAGFGANALAARRAL